MYPLRILLAIALCVIAPQGHATSNSIPLPEIYFSPDGGCTAAIVREIGRAKTSIVVQAYSFTSPPIAGALVEAFRRGVRVTAVLDKSNLTGRYSAADYLKHSGVPTFIDSRHAIAHNKVIVIDSSTVITGSFNFTKAAEENNAENILILRSASLAAQYTTNIEEHLRHSTPYYGR